MTTFTEYLNQNGGFTIDAEGDILNTSGCPITQSEFSTRFTAWLKSDSVFGSDDFYAYVDSLDLADEAACLLVGRRHVRELQSI